VGRSRVRGETGRAVELLVEVVPECTAVQIVVLDKIDSSVTMSGRSTSRTTPSVRFAVVVVIVPLPSSVEISPAPHVAASPSPRVDPPEAVITKRLCRGVWRCAGAFSQAPVWSRSHSVGS